MSEFVAELKEVFQREADPENAEKMAAYMRNLFPFYGVNSPRQKEIQRAFLKAKGLPSVDVAADLIKELWNEPPRELQYFAMRMADRYVKKTDAGFIEVYQWMVVNKSWWDTVDFIAAHLVGTHFKRFPGLIPEYTGRWMDSQNIWLQRTALLFQLKYKENTDTALLFHFIEKLADDEEFFIRKAIGWALREYSKTNPDAVLRFTSTHRLSPLSKTEALRLIKRKKL